MGRVIKAHLFYDGPSWRDEGLAGIATLYDDGPVGVVFDNSPDDGSHGVLVAFVYGDREVRWSGRDPHERREAILQSGVTAIGPAAADPIGYTEKIWSHDDLARGGYEAYATPGGWNTAESGWRLPTGAIHWAGTETASHWNGYMDGAVESGERAADEVLAALRAVKEPVR
jgi:monoamine oxidase